MEFKGDVTLTCKEENGNSSIEVGDIVNERFLIEEEVGRGGMGVVYKAYDIILRKHVAIKFYNFSGDFNNELITKLKNAKCKNLVEIYSTGRWKGRSFLVMEFIRGINLKFVDIRNWTTGKKIYLLKEILKALSKLHEIGILHLDIKPSNIMLRKDGIVKLMDFSISKNLLSLERLYRGTLKYIAPEQLSTKELDERTDIYQFGILSMYIFQNGDLSVSEEEIEKLNISKYWKYIIEKSVRKEKEKRFESVNYIIKIIDKFEVRQGRKRRLSIVVSILFILFLYLFIGCSIKQPSFYFNFGKRTIFFNKVLFPLWSIKYDHPVNEKQDSVLIKDLNGDGEKEVISVFTKKIKGTVRPVFYLTLFSYKGEVLWQKRYLLSVETRIGRVYKRPPTIRKFYTIDLNGDKVDEIVVLSNFAFFPFLIDVYSLEGRRISRFVSSGHINSIMFYDYDGDGVVELIAGGVNNEYDSAVLLILNPFSMSGKTPQTKPYYDISGYKVGKFEKFLRFSPSILCKRFILRNCVVKVSFLKDRVVIETDELMVKAVLKSLLLSNAGAKLYYMLDKNFNLIDFEISDHFKIAANHGGVKIDYDKESARLLKGVEEWNGKEWIPVKIKKGSVAWNVVYGVR